MKLAVYKTRIACTIGPASQAPEVMLSLLHAGMNIARLRYAPDDFAHHKSVIENLRRTALEAQKPLAIMADLPGPKSRVGAESRENKKMDHPGNDQGGGKLTEHDHDCLQSALENGVDAVCLSVEEPASVDAVRKAATDLGRHPFLMAKIDRAAALDHIDEILRAADGIMIARADLAAEIPVERITIIQKQLTLKAILLGKPVITTTQMLESMVNQDRPTRIECADVANAILDGTDGVMLSDESARGKFPVEAVSMLATIAAATEPHRLAGRVHEVFADYDRDHDVPLVHFISHNVQETVERLAPAAVIVSTNTGYTARMISRFKLPLWIVAVSPDEATCQGLLFSYGVHAMHEPERPENWIEFARHWAQGQGLTEGLVVLTEGPSPENPKAHHRLEVIDLSQAEPKPEAKVETPPEVKAEPKPEAKVEPPPEAKAEPKPEAKVETPPEVKAELKPEAKVEPPPEVKAEPKPEAKVEPPPEVKDEPKAEAKVEPPPEVKAEPKPEAKVVARTEAQADDMQKAEVANRSDETAGDQVAHLKRTAVMDAALEAVSQAATAS